MPLTLSFEDPFSGETIQAYLWAITTNFDFLNQTARLEFGVYRSEQAANEYRKPLSVISIDVKPEVQPAEYGPVPLISEGQPAVWSDPIFDESGEVIQPAELVSPAVDPVYGEPELIRAAVPSFQELIAANLEAYQSLSQSVYGLALSQIPGAQPIGVD